MSSEWPTLIVLISYAIASANALYRVRLTMARDSMEQIWPLSMVIVRVSSFAASSMGKSSRTIRSDRLRQRLVSGTTDDGAGQHGANLAAQHGDCPCQQLRCLIDGKIIENYQI